MTNITEYVARIVDTSSCNTNAFGNAAHVTDDCEVIAWHVTDNPENVIEQIRLGNCTKIDRDTDFGPGIYVSAIPQIWVCRFRGKWDFLGALSKSELLALCLYILKQLAEERRTHYISQSEYEYAVQDVKYVATQKLPPTVLLRLSDQPYNIRFWQEDHLKKAGLNIRSKSPTTVRMQISGKFAEMRSAHYVPTIIIDYLKYIGISGAFVKSSFSNEAQMAIWDCRAIVGTKIEKISDA